MISYMLSFALLLSATHTLAGCTPCQTFRATRSGNDPMTPDMLVHRSVWNPRITSPTGSTTWVVGQQASITWDTSNMPASVTNSKGKVVLGYTDDDSGNEHLDMDHPLADGFNLQSGRVNVKVPNVKLGHDYTITLFGDSGNTSPKFTIN